MLSQKAYRREVLGTGLHVACERENSVSAPLCIDLFCGLGGWTEGFLAEGYRVVGFDIERRPYPAQLVLQDVLTIHQMPLSSRGNAAQTHGGGIGGS
jgi:hypothetical protein